ncbi:hypothetical protein LCGC14_0416630 [marine sediment metagenome]|uniref:Uncharacterized protein n=1 Tax=marine sediment metagenome TaxID=412755 RepID=A0A0F9SY28_9ZZZZ
MRSLSDTLTSMQKASGPALCKIVLTQQGDSTTHTYDLGTTNRIMGLSHPEQEWGQTAQVLIDNRDANLSALTLEGYTAVISYGYNTSSGEEYSATAPLTVISQVNDTIFRPNGDLLTTFGLAGLFNLWGEQEASEAYAPDRINTDTVKTILDAIAGATLTAFSDYPAHTITYDSGYDDSIINAFKPKDAFFVAKGESRLSAFKKVLAYTKTKARVENDSGTATIHIFQPTTTGSTYDYEYDDAQALTNHNFFNKSVRTRLVLPNKVVVKNHPDHEDSFTGNDTDAASYAALGNQYYTETIYARTASNAECTRLAEARILTHQLNAEKGHGIAPMNVGQEVIDYINITDSAAGDSRAGNIGFLQRNYSQGSAFEFEFRFGRLLTTGLAGTLPPRGTAVDSPELSAMWDYLEGLNDNQQLIVSALESLFDRTEFTHLSVTEEMEIPQGANKFT